MNRIAAFTAALLASQSVFALTIETWVHQGTQALGTQTVVPTAMRVLDDNGQPAAGVGYGYLIDGACGTFPDGSAASGGLTDANGLATAAPWTATALTAACQLQFSLDGATGALLSTFVFSPADVALTANAAGFEIPICASRTFTVFASVGGTPVFVHPLVVSATVAPNGASATIGDVISRIDGGGSRVAFTANDKQGRYEIQASYGAGFLALPVEQKKYKGLLDCAGS